MVDKSMQATVKGYRYVSPDLTLLESVYLNQFWEIAARVYPDWLAPNAITVIGFLAIGSMFCTLLAINPSCDGSAPAWWLLAAAFAGFVYQTMDGTDGKQARRLRCGGPLGEFVDHGCDSLTTTMYAVLSAELLGIGLQEPLLFFVIHSAQLAFYSANLTLLHCNRMQTFTVDSQEAQVALQLSLAAKALKYGRSMFTWSVWSNNAWLISILPPSVAAYYADRSMLTPTTLQLRLLFLAYSVTGPLSNVLYMAWNMVFFNARQAKEKKKLKVGQGNRALARQFGTYLLWTAASSVGYTLARDKKGSFALACWTLMAMFGFADLMNRTMATRLTGAPYPTPYQHNGLVCMLSFASVLLVEGRVPSRLLDVGCGAAVVVTILSHLSFAIETGDNICDALGIQWFTVPKRDKSKDE